MSHQKLLNIALILSIITIVYNVAEGIISVYFGINDEALSLLGFGTDSFVEVISGIGIAHMVLRMKYSNVDERDKFAKANGRIVQKAKGSGDLKTQDDFSDKVVTAYQEGRENDVALDITNEIVKLK